jgi:hypothetical protein
MGRNDHVSIRMTLGDGVVDARLIRRTSPHVHVVVSPGALPPGFSGEAPDARFVPKPYRMTDVVRIIRGMGA